MTGSTGHPDPVSAPAVSAPASMLGRFCHLREAVVKQGFVIVLVGELLAALLTLLWVGNRAFSGWHRSAALLAERRAEEKAMLLSVALDRDMKAVQASVLGRFGGRRLAFRDPYDLFDIVASAFSQFPYADSIFIWRADPDHGAGHLYVFNRVDRPPVWAVGLHGGSPFPVALVEDPEPLLPLAAQIRSSDTREQFLLSDLSAHATQYQVVASIFFDPAMPQQAMGAVGFLADLTWSRRHYFGELIKQVDSVIGESGVTFSILDEDAAPVATSGAPVERDAVAFDRQFPLAFFDRSLLAAQSKPGSIPLWTIRVNSTANIEPGSRPWNALWWLMSIAAAASFVSAVLIVRSVRATADVAAMKSEFVATVTHELKTPLALIKAVGETLEFGRYSRENRVDEYGKMLGTEATRLALRIDNLLAYARATDGRESYRSDMVDLLEVVNESLHRAEPRLHGFEVDINLGDAPLVVGDHSALLHVFDNIIDNAIKYSAERKSISVRTVTDADMAVVSVVDRGIGIEPGDVTRVFEKFFRGRTGHSGSGLGLAIAERIVRMHGGTVHIESLLGHGTTVIVRLPLDHHP
jgi:signal transduction histidine kinase